MCQLIITGASDDGFCPNILIHSYSYSDIFHVLNSKMFFCKYCWSWRPFTQTWQYIPPKSLQIRRPCIFMQFMPLLSPSTLIGTHTFLMLQRSPRPITLSLIRWSFGMSSSSETKGLAAPPNEVVMVQLPLDYKPAENETQWTSR